MNNRELDFIDLISILSFILGYENLVENREQSRHNDVSAANDAQAKFLLEKIDMKFEEQNRTLKHILEIVNEIDRKLDGIEKR